MKKILHISTECYPAAKAGGMGDVVGALPLYLPEHNVEASVITPKYKRKWFHDQNFTVVFSGEVNLDGDYIGFEIQKLESDALSYPFYCVNIPGLFDREDIYLDEDGHGYRDEDRRYISFQISILIWLTNSDTAFDVFHCHDHMTGLIPFFIKFCPDFDELKNTPTVFTIHNGQYRGIFNWGTERYFPYYDHRYNGMLDWDGHINSLATAIKCSWIVNTVSPAYMEELITDFDTLTSLVQNEREKCHGIINGIDNDLWNPATDEFLDVHLDKNQWKKFKSANKSALLKKYDLKARRPMIGFIGRMAYQKGADILISSIEKCLEEGMQFTAVILGSGDKGLEHSLNQLAERYPRDVAVIIAYNEKWAREIYAGCDFLMMPSRFEPCGLNQMYAMRYGTVPIVSPVGGLKDTVPDIKKRGVGIVAEQVDGERFSKTIERAIELYKDKTKFNKLLKKIVAIDFSWNQSAKKYSALYKKLTN